MLKRIGILVAGVAFASVLTLNLISSNDPKQDSSFSLGFLLRIAKAETESCVKDIEHFKKPENNGYVCYCEDLQKIVAITICKSSFTESCTPINCN